MRPGQALRVATSYYITAAQAELLRDLARVVRRLEIVLVRVVIHVPATVLRFEEGDVALTLRDVTRRQVAEFFGAAGTLPAVSAVVIELRPDAEWFNTRLFVNALANALPNLREVAMACTPDDAATFGEVFPKATLIKMT